MSMISASKVGWGLAKISSEGGKIFNIFIYIFCTAFCSIDSHCIQVKLKNFKVNRIIFAIPKRFSLPMRIPIFGRCGYNSDQVVFQKSPAGGAIFMLSADFLKPPLKPPPRRRFTHHKPAAIPPQNHLVTFRNRGGFNFYRGERISNCW